MALINIIFSRLFNDVPFMHLYCFIHYHVGIFKIRCRNHFFAAASEPPKTDHPDGANCKLILTLKTHFFHFLSLVSIFGLDELKWEYVSLMSAGVIIQAL